MNSSISLKKAGLNFVVYKVTHCAGCISANTRLQPYMVFAKQPICVRWSQKRGMIATSQLLQACFC